jgi:hypothetical protein
MFNIGDLNGLFATILALATSGRSDAPPPSSAAVPQASASMLACGFDRGGSRLGLGFESVGDDDAA